MTTAYISYELRHFAALNDGMTINHFDLFFCNRFEPGTVALVALGNLIGSTPKPLHIYQLLGYHGIYCMYLGRYLLS